MVGCRYNNCRLPLHSGTSSFGGDFGLPLFWSIQAVSVIAEPLCDAETPHLSPNNSAQGHLMKIKWLVTDVTAVGSPDIEERTILGVNLAGSIQAVFAFGGPLCEAVNPS